MREKTDSVEAVSITLSPNDAGETGGHQAGLLVPKSGDVLKFFPVLPTVQKNPRCSLTFADESGESWTFSFIYYNNKKFGGTRDEYRLTRMTRYLKKYHLRAGDEVVLSRDHSGNYRVSHRRKRKGDSGDSSRLKIGSRWRVVRI